MKVYSPWRAVIAVAVVLVVCSVPGSVQAEVNLNINIGAPPVVVAEPPEVVLIPEFEVYFIPGGDADLFFHAGFWWSPRGDRWYRASAYNGPWVAVRHHVVPRQVIQVPSDYRVRYRKAIHVPYGQWKKAHYREYHEDGRDGGYHNGKEYKNKGKWGRSHDD